MSIVVPYRIFWTAVGDITMRLPCTLPNCEMISAATPTTCGVAIDVPWKQPQPPGIVDRISSAQPAPIVVSLPPGAATSAQPEPQLEYAAFSLFWPSATTAVSPGDIAGTVLHPLPPGGWARFWSELPIAEMSDTPLL